jgi:hypothetical protein
VHINITRLKYHRVDLIQLVEEAVDGCWIGHQARMAAANDFDIGSVYAPPKEGGLSKTALPSNASHVEVVIDIGYREGVCCHPCDFCSKLTMR